MKILCFGDSNTYGYDPRSFCGGRYPAQGRWVNLLAEKLCCEVVNAGENGRGIPKSEWEINRFNGFLINQKPLGRLIVMLGSNDLLQGNSAESVAEQMESFLERVDLERSKILLIVPPPMMRGEWVAEQALIDASIELGREYQKCSQRLGVLFADAGEWDIPLAFDGVHFTEEGHKAFAEGLCQKLRDITDNY